MNTTLHYSCEEPRTPKVRAERRALIEKGMGRGDKNQRGKEMFDVCSLK